MSKFYLLTVSEDLPENKRAEYTDDVDFEQITCSKVKGHMRGGKRITKLFLKIPNNNDDIIKTWYSDWLINNKVKELLKENKITDYKLEDIAVVKDKRKGDNFGKKLYELVVTGDGGNIHHSSGYKLVEVCDQCGARKFKSFNNGIIVDESKWDKSDIFTVREYSKYVLVTQKVKDLFDGNQIKGCIFIPAEEFKLHPLVANY